MANNQLSTDYSNNVRSVQTIFEMLVEKQPTFLSLVTRGADAIATKEEWLEDSLTQSTTTVSNVNGDGAGTSITVASAAGLAVGDLLRFETSAGADRGEICKISAISTNTLTLVRRIGGNPGSAVTLAVSDVVIRMSRPLGENTTATAVAGAEPVSNFNYTQIFDRVVTLSATVQAIQNYGNANAMAYQMERKMQEIMFEVNQALIWGERELRTGSVNGAMGGLLSFLRGGNVDTTGGNISAAIINNMLEAVYADGASSNNYAILCNTNQAKRISAFNTAGSNPVVSVPQGSTTTGGYISTFVGNLPVANGPFTARVVVEPSFPKDKIALVDMNRIELAYLRPFETKDATVNGQDGTAQRIIGELTARIKDGQKAHAIATGLNV